VDQSKMVTRVEKNLGCSESLFVRAIVVQVTNRERVCPRLRCKSEVSKFIVLASNWQSPIGSVAGRTISGWQKAELAEFLVHGKLSLTTANLLLHD
jgi:hypothetical protein